MAPMLLGPGPGPGPGPQGRGQAQGQGQGQAQAPRARAEPGRAGRPAGPVYRGFRIDGPASSWPRGYGKSKSSWPSKNGFGHNSAGLSPILIRICMVKDTIMNKKSELLGLMGLIFEGFMKDLLFNKILNQIS